VQWHVDCGVSLPFIYANPDKPCVKLSTLWTTALRDKQYEFASYVSPEQMIHSPVYIRALIAELRRLHPGRR